MAAPRHRTSEPIGPYADLAAFWGALRERGAAAQVTPPPPSSVMELGVRTLTALASAPPRTLHSAPLIKSSPLSPQVRAMFEAREFGRRFDAAPLDVAAAESVLPTLAVPAGDVPFLACDRSPEDLSLSVDGLLQHRKRLLAAGLDRTRPRRHVLVVGAGPAGLMAAVQLALRDHHVVVCEAREVYTRNRYIGVYKEITHLLAALGMPEGMTYDFSQYRGKRGIMLADIQTLLHGLALKLGVVIYTGTVTGEFDPTVLRSGEVELQRAPRAGGQTPAVGLTRWQHDLVAKVASGVVIRFDTVVEASGGRSGLRETLVGSDNVVDLRDIGIAAARQDPTLESFLDDPEDHCAEYVESGYGCPPGTRPAFAAALLSGTADAIPDAIPCFVSNIDATIFKEPMHQTPDSLGLASRIGDRDLAIPHDWVVLECRVSDQRLSRYHIEGPLPQTFAFGDRRLATGAILEKLNPLSLLLRILYAMGVPSDAVDRRQLVEFYAAESSQTDAADIVGTWVGRFRGLRVGGEVPIWWGKVPGSEAIAYGIIGESLQNAWYRFGVGVDDAITAAGVFAAMFDLDDDARLAAARRLERVMRSRAVQILYHLFAVARNTDQGVVGSVLTEYHMEERHNHNLAEARLRDLVRDGAEMAAAQADVRGTDPVLDEALDVARRTSWLGVVGLFEQLSYRAEALATARRWIGDGGDGWAERTAEALAGAVSPAHRALLESLAVPPGQASEARREERLIELAAGRYHWVKPWLRACALRMLDPAFPEAAAVLKLAVEDANPLVAETARTVLNCRTAVGRTAAFDKVLILRRVGIFAAVPNQLLADVAPLVTERVAIPGERIIEKGETGDALYVVVRGRVRVHDGERSIREIGADDCVGELSLLDSEPRSASVTAIEETRLFRLGQDDFYALLRDQPEISRAINRALCQRLRAS